MLENAVTKASLILETFNIHDRFSEITTYHKETFDLLWKMCKIMKPIVGIFISPQDAFLFDSAFDFGSFKTFIIKSSGSKDRMIELSPELIHTVQCLERYKEVSKNLLEKYETIISNLVGYADLVTMMKSYNSKVSLFKYAISLAHEASVLESSSKGDVKAKMKYSQALLVINLILKKQYDSRLKERGYPISEERLEYVIIDEQGKQVSENSELETEVEDVLRIHPLKENEAVYMYKIRRELYSKLTSMK